MSSAPTKFKSLDLTKAYAVIDDFAANNNVPDLQFPNQQGADVVAMPAPATDGNKAVPVKGEKARKASKRSNTPEEEGPLTRRMTLDLPTYLFSAIARRGFDQSACAKYVILQALQADGFEINPDDMTKDGRRSKKAARHDA